MINKILIVCCMLLTSVAAAQVHTTPQTRIAVFKGDEIIAQIVLPKDKIQVKANTLSYGENDTTILSGNVTISVPQKDKPPIQIFADKAEVETALTEVQVQLSGTEEFRREAAEGLLSTLKATPKSPTFRVTWYTGVASYGANATAIYDRRKQNLVFRCIGSRAGGVHEKPTDENYLYSGVTTDEKAAAVILHTLTGEDLPEGVKRRKLR